MTAQLFRSLTRDEEIALRASIERFGVLVPVIRDAAGDLIDGNHRSRIAAELGAVVPEIRLDLEGDDALAAARDLNLARRHLDKAERAGYAIQRFTTERPPSKRQIARELGVSEFAVRKDLGAIENAPDRVVGGDGKIYPARRLPRPPNPEPEPDPVLFEPELPAGFEILCRDARDFYPGDGPADLAFTSPPYNVGIDYAGDDDGDALPHGEWLDLLETVWKVLIGGWRVSWLIVNVPFGTDRRPYRFLLGDVIQSLDDAGATLEGVGVWDKGGISNRTSWGSWRSPSAPSMRDRAEALIVCRGQHGREPAGLVDVDGRRYSPLLDGERFARLTQNVWQISAVRTGPQYGDAHPAPFPVEARRKRHSAMGMAGLPRRRPVRRLRHDRCRRAAARMRSDSDRSERGLLPDDPPSITSRAMSESRRRGDEGELLAEGLLVYAGWEVVERHPRVLGHLLDRRVKHSVYGEALVEVKVWGTDSGKDTVKKAIADAYDLQRQGCDAPYILILSHDLTGLNHDMLERAMASGAIWQVLVLALVPLGGTL